MVGKWIEDFSITGETNNKWWWCFLEARVYLSHPLTRWDRKNAIKTIAGQDLWFQLGSPCHEPLHITGQTEGWTTSWKLLESCALHGRGRTLYTRTVHPWHWRRAWILRPDNPIQVWFEGEPITQASPPRVPPPAPVGLRHVFDVARECPDGVTSRSEASETRRSLSLGGVV